MARLKKAETTILLLLDGCRRDYVTPGNAPFLHALMERALTGSIEPAPGFSQRATLLTGTYPDTSNSLGAFGYAPESSPFRWVGRLGPLARAYRPIRAFAPFRLAVKQLSRRDPAWIPGTHLPSFAADEAAPPHAGIPELLRAQGRAFRSIARPGKDEDVHRALLDALRGPDEHALVLAHFDGLDERGHKHGPLVPDGFPPAARQTDKDREAMRKEIRETDRRCREVHEALAATHERFHLLVVGDHGMAPVMQKVNVLRQVESLRLKAGRDYTLFLDSTMAKVWFHNDKARDAITTLFTDQTYGRIVNPEERRERRIPLDRRHGDLLFAADPGVLFWPDYFHVVERDVKGMHGYLDKKVDAVGEAAWGAETTGLLIVDSPAAGAPRDLGVRSLVDVFPTLCALAGVDTPPTNEGRSLLEEHAALA